MGKKKRRGKQKKQDQLQLEGAELDDSNFESITETMPEADTPSLNNNASNGHCMTIPSVINNMDSPIPASKKEQESSSKELGDEHTNPEHELLTLNISKEKNNSLTPGNIPELLLEHKSQVSQPAPSTVTADKVPDTPVKANVENNSSIEGSFSLKNVTDCVIASETSHQQQTPIEITSTTRFEGENILEEKIMNIDEHGKSLNISPESTSPSNKTYPVKPSMIPSKEEHKITAKPIEEEPDVSEISSEKSTTVINESEEKSLIEKCSQYPNTPAKSGQEESITKIEVKNQETDSKQNADSSISEFATGQENKEEKEREDINSLYQINSQKEANNNQQSEKLLSVEKNEPVQHNSNAVEGVAEENLNDFNISSKADNRKCSKKNKTSNVNQSKAKAKKGIEDKPSLSSDNCESSKPEEINQNEKIEVLEKGTAPKIMQNPSFEEMAVNTTLREETDLPVCEIQPVKEDVNFTGGENVTVKDEAINIIPTYKIKPSPEVITEEKDTGSLNKLSSKETGNNEMKQENNTMLSTDITDDMKNCSQVCSSSPEERTDFQTISCSQPEETESARSHPREEVEKNSSMQTSELCTGKIYTEDSEYLSFKGKKEVGKKHSNAKQNDKDSSIGVQIHSNQEKTTTDVINLNTPSEAVLDSFADTNLNTIFSRNKKGMSKQNKNENKRNSTTDKRTKLKPSGEDKTKEDKNPEAVIKDEAVTGTLQQTQKTIGIRTNNSISSPTVSPIINTNTNFSNIQESHAKLTRVEGEGLSLLHREGRVPARPIFMANTCYVCKLTHGGSTRLQTCSACRLITYCSKEHQKKHWKEHKSVCQVVHSMVRQRGLADLFSNAHKITDPEEWRKFRCILLTEAENYLGRVLLPYEREMFLFPRTCGKCHKSDPEILKVCKLCHYVNFCCNEHIPSDHHIWCQDLKLLLEINQYQSLYGLIKPFIPNFKLNESKPFPKDMKDFILNYISREKSFDLFNLYEATLSDVASYPLTVLYVINYLKKSNFSTTSNKLSIHIVGAESQFETDTLSKWDSFLINLIPDLVQLNLVFIGPELIPNITNKMNCGNYEIMNVETIDPSKQLVTEFHYGKLYHEYAKEEIFTKPDMIFAFNCGIYRFTGFEKEDTWGPTMSSMLKYPNTPIILTAYTAVEAPKDVERFQNQFKIKMIHNVARNPFSSMRPNLNFVSDDETPVIYKNQYLSIIVKGD